MFVDEGFGSLDEDALDQAIRALKDLSQGSRLVGIVSHVAELKERIDKKIIVTKETDRRWSWQYDLYRRMRFYGQADKIIRFAMRRYIE